MSAFNIIKAIEKEAKARSDRQENDAYELEIRLTSGKRLIISPYASDSYFLKASMVVFDELKNREGETITYIPYEAIEQVTPTWLP